MATEPNKRPRRTPLTHEEVATVIELKKRREHIKLLKLKRSGAYKIQNIFNVACFFIFCELIFCYFGPCHYQLHYSENVVATLGMEAKGDGTPIVSEIDMICAHGKTYKFIIDDYIELPPKLTTFVVGKDYLLHRDIKGSIAGSNRSYRVFSASPVLFLSIFTSIIMLIAIGNNLNENEHSLTGLTIINAMTLLCVLFM
jgi:hypothetical protein